MGRKASYTVSSGAINPVFVIDEASMNWNDVGGNKPVHEAKVPARQQWGNDREFLLSCIAMSVGLGNVWRFPFTAYENGGGAFLIPYIIILFVVGKPFYLLEMILGQFSSRSAIKVWELAPAFKGIGIAQFITMLALTSYYCSLMALTLFYLVACFQTELPWGRCRKEWGEYCVDSLPGNNSIPPVDKSASYSSSAELYFYKEVLREKDNIDDGIGVPDWRLTIALLVSWLTVFVVVIRGVQSSGKAAYFLAIFPYLVLIVLLARAVTLDGSVDGILYFVTPKWHELLTPKIWYNAVAQCFFSLTVCFGAVVMFASHNKFEHDVYRDAVIVTTLDTFTSLLAGCTIFGILGNLSRELGKEDVGAVVRGGTGLAFISYPETIAKFTVAPQFFGVVFFVMIFVLGIGSEVGLTSAIIAIVRDQFPSVKHWHAAAGTCFCEFLIGLIYVTPGGQFMVTFVDYYVTSFIAFLPAAFEIIAVAWVYGLDNFLNDIEFMLKRRLSIFWRLCWSIVTPGIVLIIFFYTVADLKLLNYNGTPYPTSAYAIGWILFSVAVLQIPLWIVIALFKKRHLPLREREKQQGLDNVVFQLDESSVPHVGKRCDVPICLDIEPENERSRATWNNSIEFLMSCIAVSVGFGNIWRFPFTAFENGGGAFLIPYVILLFLVGKPFYFLEMIIGQFSGNSSVKVWSVSPGFAGVGWAQFCSTLALATYYSSLMAITLYYLIASFASELPWSTCQEGWDTCVDSSSKRNHSISVEGIEGSATNLDVFSVSNNTTKLQSSAELYFTQVVLHEKSSIEDGIGLPDWKLTLCLFGSWMTVCLVLSRGVKSSGRFSYFLAIFPYIVLISLLARALTLDGAINGIYYFITPKWSKLLDPTVWYAAVTQCFFSLSVCFGSIITYSSHNSFKHNIYRDVMIITSLDTATSMLAGCTIFGILGNLAYELGIEDVSKVVRGGAGLAFVSYPDAIAKFNFMPQLFSVLFFVMMFVLGIGSAVGMSTGIITVINQQFPRLKTWHIVVPVCLSGFAIGTIYVTPGGQFILTLVDYYGTSFVVFILASFEMTGVIWVYGLENFLEDLEFMLDRKPSIYWRICWFIITPFLLILIFIYTVISLSPLTYSGIALPDSAHAAGWILLCVGVLQIPLWMLIAMFKNRQLSFSQMLRKAFAPTSEWGPREVQQRKNWMIFKEEKARIRENRIQPVWKQTLSLLLNMEPK